MGQDAPLSREGPARFDRDASAQYVLPYSLGLVRFHFDDCELDVSQRLLRRRGESVPLTPKAFALLELLLRRRPAVVSKDEVYASLWPGTFVAEANIPNLIAEIRSALGDSARHPRYIRTAFRTGYAFVGTVTDPAAPPLPPPPPALESKRMCSLVGDGRTIPLHDGKHVIGRSSECDLQLASSAVSRRHAALYIRGTRAVIQDLKSRNGTFVRGRRVKRPAELRDGDRLRVGDVAFVFRLFSPMSTTHRIGTGGFPLRPRRILGDS